MTHVALSMVKSKSALKDTFGTLALTVETYPVVTCIV